MIFFLNSVVFEENCGVAAAGSRTKDFSKYAKDRKTPFNYIEGSGVQTSAEQDNAMQSKAFELDNNPVRYVDPDGKSTHIFSIPVTPFDRHLFIVVKDKDGNITTKSLYPQSQLKAIKDVITVIHRMPYYMRIKRMNMQSQRNIFQMTHYRKELEKKQILLSQKE